MQLNLMNHLSIAGLAIILSTSFPISTLARPMPIAKSTTCQASLSIGQGKSLNYRFTGIILDRIPANTPQNPIGRTITMTVQQRDRDGRTTTLLNQAIVKDYEQIAPDADYSKLPFTGEFRGKPNDGFRLYGVNAAKQGLYISLRPTQGQPQKMQIVHYLSPGKFIRSTQGQCYQNP